MATVHPNQILYRKLQEMKNLPITEQVKRHMNINEKTQVM